MPGYHSPQVDVAVRLNTNEAPSRRRRSSSPPVASALATIEWHRYPDRGCRTLREAIAKHHAVEPEQVFAANGSNEVLQTVLPRLRRSRPARGGVRAHVRAAQPHRPDHRHRRRRRANAATTSRSTWARSDGWWPSMRRRSHLPVLAQQPDRHGRPPRRGGRGARHDTGPRRGRRGVRPVRPWSALGMVGDGRHVVVSAPSPRRGRWPAPGSATWSAPRGGGGARQGRAAVPPRRGEAGRGAAGPVVHGRDAGPGRGAGRGAGRAAAALADLPVDVWRSGANFILFRPRAGRRRRVAGAPRPLGPDAQLRRLAPASRAACGSRSAPRPRTTPSSPPSPRCW